MTLSVGKIETLVKNLEMQQVCSVINGLAKLIELNCQMLILEKKLEYRQHHQ